MKRSIKMKAPVSRHDRIRIKGHGRRGRQIAEPDLVEPERPVRQMRQRLHIDAVFERGNGGRHCARPDLQQIGAAGDERLVAHPDHMRGELVDEFRWLARVREQIAARNIDIASKVRVTASPSRRDRAVPSKVTISLSLADRPEPANKPSSPRRDRAGHHGPEKPRKSPFGRLTHCTGKRNGRWTRAPGNVD